MGYDREESLLWDPNDDTPHPQGYPAQENIDDFPDGYSITHQISNCGYDYGGVTCSMCRFAMHLCCVGDDLGDSVLVCRSCTYREHNGCFPEER